MFWRRRKGKRINLEMDQKQNLAEILLIVATLLATLGFPNELRLFFAIFVLSAIMYILLLMMYKKEKEKDNFTINFFAFLTAIFFSPILAYQLGLGIGFSITGPYTLDIIMIVVIFYIIAIWWVVYKALRMPEYDLDKAIKTHVKNIWDKIKNIRKK